MFGLMPWREDRGRSGGLMHPLERMRDEFDQLFNRFFGGWREPVQGERGPGRFWDFDVTEDDKEMVVRAEMPGFDLNDINVQVRGDQLSIWGEKKQQGEHEQRYGRFRRTVTLPPGVDTDKAQATFQNGLLELHLPIKEEARARRIPVQGHTAGGGPQTAPAGAQGAQQTAQAGGKSTARQTGK
jgi:HSP20 family protein